MRYRSEVLPKLIKQLYLIGFKVKSLYYINTHKCKENQPKLISGSWDLGNTQYWTDINIKASLRLVVWLTFLHSINVKCAVHCSMSSPNCCFWTYIQISQEVGEVVWYSHLFKNFPHFVVIHTVKGFSIVNESEVDVFLKFSCFFYDPMDVDNLISDSSTFSHPILNIWKFSDHLLLKPSLENFEHYFASMWDECNCVVVWTFFGIALSLGLEWKLTFSSPMATAEFSKFAGILSAALSRHHLSGFETAPLEFHHLH